MANLEANVCLLLPLDGQEGVPKATMRAANMFTTMRIPKLVRKTLAVFWSVGKIR
jgi:hypothetical protein